MCAMTAEAYKTNDKYCMRIRYYIIDNYEFAVHWEAPDEPSGLDRAGHRMHETGLANEYKVIGVYEDFVTWDLGETLYSNDYIDIELDEDRYNAGPTN